MAFLVAGSAWKVEVLFWVDVWLLPIVLHPALSATDIAILKLAERLPKCKRLIEALSIPSWIKGAVHLVSQKLVGLLILFRSALRRRFEHIIKDGASICALTPASKSIRLVAL